MKTKIIVGEDYDGFLGNDQSIIDKLDIDQSIVNYESLVSEMVNEWYPEIEIEFEWGGQTYLDPFEGNIDFLQEDLDHAEEVVYNSQDFWVWKE